MNTYGFHSIHGRAPTLATGLKVARPDLMVWVITGDGDALSIGGNHILHAMRKNVDIRVVMFNNRIYGLTKGQASPTSELGQKTKSTPIGSIDYPIHPLMIALAAEASFVARTVDTQADHIQGVIERAGFHRGSAFVEVLQNCNIFNDGAHRDFTDREVRDDRMLDPRARQADALRQEPGHGASASTGCARRSSSSASTASPRPTSSSTTRRARIPRSTTCSPGSTGRSSRSRSASSATSPGPPTTS